MLTLKEFDPRRVILVDENGEEKILTAEDGQEFDRDLIEDIIES